MDSFFLMIINSLDDKAYKRLLHARDTRKYGHLQSWHELVAFQMCIASPQQKQEIAAFAKRNNRGEKIILPLMKNKQVGIE